MVTRNSCAIVRSLTATAIVAFACVLGCQPSRLHSTKPSSQPHSLACADGPARIPPGVVLASPADLVAGLRKPQHVLVLSSGGLYGSYSAGVLDGWTQTGTRPEFDVVTGTSTGALIAPFAFLGSDYDAQAMNLYTGIRNHDIYRFRAWVLIPFRDSLATTAPLRKLIETQINQDLLNKIAIEHRKGRRLYVGTTDLFTRRTVIWDLGAIACRPCPDGCRLFRDVLLASASVPGVFPPVEFAIEVDGKPMTELHIDGGVTAPVFVPSGVFATAKADGGALGMNTMGNVYVIVAGKMFPDEGPVRRRILPVVRATTDGLIHAHCRAEIATIYLQSRLAGMRFHYVALNQESRIQIDSAVDFNQDIMKQLYREGVEDGKSGPSWNYVPPSLSPSDGNYARGGWKLRTMPPVEIPAP